MAQVREMEDRNENQRRERYFAEKERFLKKQGFQGRADTNLSGSSRPIGSTWREYLEENVETSAPADNFSSSRSGDYGKPVNFSSSRSSSHRSGTNHVAPPQQRDNSVPRQERPRTSRYNGNLAPHDIIELDEEGFRNPQDDPLANTQWFLLKEEELLQHVEDDRHHKIKTAQRLHFNEDQYPQTSTTNLPPHIERLRRGERPSVRKEEIIWRSANSFAQLPEVRMRNYEILKREDADRRRLEVKRLDMHRRRLLRSGVTDL